MYKNLFLIKKVSVLILTICLCSFLCAMEQNEAKNFLNEKNDNSFFSLLITQVTCAVKKNKEDQNDIKQKIVQCLRDGVNPDQPQMIPYVNNIYYLPLTHLVSFLPVQGANHSFIKEIIGECISYGADPDKSIPDKSYYQAAGLLCSAYQMAKAYRLREAHNFMKEKKEAYLQDERNRKNCYLMLISYKKDKQSFFGKLPQEIIKEIGLYVIHR